VLLEFSKEGDATLSFFKNGEPKGKCYDRIPPNTYYPVVCLSNPHREVVVSLNSRAKIPAKLARSR